MRQRYLALAAALFLGAGSAAFGQTTANDSIAISGSTSGPAMVGGQPVLVAVTFSATISRTTYTGPFSATISLAHGAARIDVTKATAALEVNAPRLGSPRPLTVSGSFSATDGKGDAGAGTFSVTAGPEGGSGTLTLSSGQSVPFSWGLPQGAAPPRGPVGPPHNPATAAVGP